MRRHRRQYGLLSSQAARGNYRRKIYCRHRVPGGADIELAVERGKMQCRAISIPVYFGREPYHTWRQKGLARILVQTGTKRESRLADVPTLYELMDQYQTSDAN